MLSARVATILCLFFTLGNLMPMPGKHFLIETEGSSEDGGMYFTWNHTKKFQKNTRSDVRIQNIESIKSIESIIGSVTIFQNYKSLGSRVYNLTIYQPTN